MLLLAFTFAALLMMLEGGAAKVQQGRRQSISSPAERSESTHYRQNRGVSGFGQPQRLVRLLYVCM
jgi:hypothetical protein